VTQVYAEEAGDRLGIWVRAGDLNGDPIDDIVVGADGADGPDNNRSKTGSAYILYGRSDWPAVVDLASPSSGDRVLFHGIDPDDHFGGTVGVADINGDGRNDVLVGAALRRSGAVLGGGPGLGGGDGPPGNGRADAGDTYVFFNPGVWPDTIQAASPPASVSMTVVYGAMAGDYTGEEVLGGDLDGDGDEELIIGGFLASPFGRRRAGVAYVLEGGKHFENRVIDLASIPQDLQTTTLYGADEGDIFGDTMAVGDVDRDGANDLCLASPNHDGPRGIDQGRVDIFLGTKGFLFPPEIDLASLPLDLRRVTIYGPRQGDILAYSMAIGDWDQDGYMDPMPNGMGADGFQDAFLTAGDAYVISGAALSDLLPTPTPTEGGAPTPTPTPVPTRSADLNRDERIDSDDLFLFQDQYFQEVP